MEFSEESEEFAKMQNLFTILDYFIIWGSIYLLFIWICIFKLKLFLLNIDTCYGKWSFCVESILTETGSEDDGLLDGSEDDFFVSGSSSDDGNADDEWTDKSTR